MCNGNEWTDLCKEQFSCTFWDVILWAEWEVTRGMIEKVLEEMSGIEERRGREAELWRPARPGMLTVQYIWPMRSVHKPASTKTRRKELFLVWECVKIYEINVTILTVNCLKYTSHQYITASLPVCWLHLRRCTSWATYTKIWGLCRSTSGDPGLTWLLCHDCHFGLFSASNYDSS